MFGRATIRLGIGPHSSLVLHLCFSEPELTFVHYMLSPVRLSSVVGNAHAPYSADCNFRQYFYGVRYLGHPLTFNENFTEIVPGEPLRRES